MSDNPLNLDRTESYWDPKDARRKDASAEAPSGIPKLSPWIYVFLGVTTVVGLLFVFSGGDRPRQASARAPEPAPRASSERPDRGESTRARGESSSDSGLRATARSSGGGRARESADFSEDSLSEVQLGQIESNVRMALRMGTRSGAVRIEAWREQDLFDEWRNNAEQLHERFKLVLKAVGGRPKEKQMRFKVSFDGGVTWMGTLVVREIQHRWTIVSVKSI